MATIAGLPWSGGVTAGLSVRSLLASRAFLAGFVILVDAAHTGPFAVLTAMTGVAVNALNIAGGIFVFGDPLATGLSVTVAEAAAFICICAAAFLTPEPAPQSPHASRSVLA